MFTAKCERKKSKTAHAKQRVASLAISAPDPGRPPRDPSDTPLVPAIPGHDWWPMRWVMVASITANPGHDWWPRRWVMVASITTITWSRLVDQEVGKGGLLRLRLAGPPRRSPGNSTTFQESIPCTHNAAVDSRIRDGGRLPEVSQRDASSKIVSPVILLKAS